MMRKPMTVKGILAELEQLESAGWGDSIVEVEMFDGRAMNIASIALDSNSRGIVRMRATARIPKRIVVGYEGRDVVLFVGTGNHTRHTFCVWNDANKCHEAHTASEMVDAFETADAYAAYVSATPYVARTSVTVQYVAN